jgi:hypothetical protein
MHPLEGLTSPVRPVQISAVNPDGRKALLYLEDSQQAGHSAGRSFGRILVALLFSFVVSPAFAVKNVEPEFPPASVELPPSTPISYTDATDAELRTLGARWGYLSAAERRALLAEIRLRMVRDNGGSTRVRIQATRQFGVVKRPDGTTIRVERRIIRMIPAEQGYGTGFEQRVGEQRIGEQTVGRDDVQQGAEAGQLVVQDGLSATPQEAELQAQLKARLKAEMDARASGSAAHGQSGESGQNLLSPENGLMPASTVPAAGQSGNPGRTR